MSDLIDRQALVDHFTNTWCKDCDDYGGIRCRGCATDDAIFEIEDAPAIDAVPVVRCGDCRHYLFTGYGKNKKCYRPMRGGNGGHRMKADDFCSYGERREESDGNP